MPSGAALVLYFIFVLAIVFAQKLRQAMKKQL
jgi:hypothetical protein